MDQNKLELLNIVTDLRRIVAHCIGPQPQNSDPFRQNLISSWPKLKKLDPGIEKYLDINYLKKNSDPYLIQAEHFLTASLRLQHYLAY
jgi:hypothetical protein